MDIQAKLNDDLFDHACLKVETYAEGSWSFDFGGNTVLHAQCPWRIVNKDGIAVSGSDHRQMFGLKQPLDVPQLALTVLFGKQVEMVVVTGKTADLVIYFTDNIELQLFNDSSGYEGWNISTKSGINVIGMGGGTAVSSQTSS